MAERKTIKVFLRVDSDGRSTAVTEDDIAMGTDVDSGSHVDETDKRDVTIDVTLTLPEKDRAADVSIEVPDEEPAPVAAAAVA